MRNRRTRRALATFAAALALCGAREAGGLPMEFDATLTIQVGNLYTLSARSSGTGDYDPRTGHMSLPAGLAGPWLSTAVMPPAYGIPFGPRASTTGSPLRPRPHATASASSGS